MGVVLTMIVKDEAEIIAQAIRSARPHITSYVIVDTGSTDDTIKVALAELEGLPGSIVMIPWQGFADARSTALRRARSQDPKGYALMLDADDVVSAGPGQAFDQWEHDGYHVTVHDDVAGFSWHRCQLFSNQKAWEYRGVVHEYPYLENSAGALPLSSFRIKRGFGGARAKNPDRFLHDAALLLAEHERNPTDTRTVFYLAQSYRDAGEDGKGLEWYIKRSQMGGWTEEVYISLLEAGKALWRLGQDPCTLFSIAAEQAPGRAEALYYMARYIDAQRLTIKMPATGLFLEKRAYEK